MKKRWIVIAVIIVVLMMFVSRFAVIERADVLPEELRALLRHLSGAAAAQTQSPDADDENQSAVTAVPPPVRPNGQVSVQVQQPTSAPSSEPTATAEPTATPEPTPIPTPTPVPTPTPRLERGSRGEEVKAIQTRLQELGFLSGKADGIYGAKTEQAVKEFRQHVYDLEQERLLAEQARLEEERRLEEEKRLEEERKRLEQQQQAADSETPTPSSQPTDEPVQSVIPSPTADASAEPTIAPEVTPQQTEEVPSEVPAEEVLPPVIEGKVDDQTYYLLAEGGFDEYQEKLLSGSRGVEVKRLQTRLKALGYLTGKADGIYGQKTVSAVKAFQKQNRLTQDGIAGEKTQRKLYSLAAAKAVKVTAAAIDKNLTAEQKKYHGNPYYLKVSTADQRVYAYSWNEADGAYNKLARTMVCSTGLADTPTPKGTYHSETAPRVEWGYFPKYDVWAQYLYRIKGPYLFHSVLYAEKDESTIKWGSVNKLGTPASHGCVRLSVEDAKWIYQNCPAGTYVTVY